MRLQIAQTIVHLGIELNNLATYYTCRNEGKAAPRKADVHPTRVTDDGSHPNSETGKRTSSPIQVDMHDRHATALEEDLTSKFVTLGAKGVWLFAGLG
jgi:hypothetical protein